MLGNVRRRLETFIVPPPQGFEERSDDYRPVVSVIAAAAVGFFLPSLLIADVPVDLWAPFAVLAGLAGVVIAGTFFVRHPSTQVAIAFALANAVFIAVLGHVYRPWYHEVPLLFALLVAAHAVVHGLRVASFSVAAGSLLVPAVIQDPAAGFNWTDPVYTVIYLFGVALVAWTASRLAAQRLTAVRDQLAITLETEREAVHILARAAEAKDEVTGDHVLRVGDLSAALARRAGLEGPIVEDLKLAAMLHDVGKLHVPDSILMKPGPLTPDEWAVVREHTIRGERILGTTRGFSLARTIARSHHENWDGSGYPDGLVQDAIPMAARIVRLADTFDALHNVRPYKLAWPLERCMDEIEARAGSLFDPELAREFLLLLDGLDWLRAMPPPMPSTAIASARNDQAAEVGPTGPILRATRPAPVAVDPEGLRGAP